MSIISTNLKIHIQCLTELIQGTVKTVKESLEYNSDYMALDKATRDAILVSIISQATSHTDKVINLEERRNGPKGKVQNTDI